MAKELRRKEGGLARGYGRLYILYISLTKLDDESNIQIETAVRIGSNTTRSLFPPYNRDSSNKRMHLHSSAVS